LFLEKSTASWWLISQVNRLHEGGADVHHVDARGEAGLG
jgi:hypothetical protein